ncbi:MAG TPA: tRNA (adenosine(37)-N6)-threonylcarbamoyltransferase complex transferase subunit TsaD [Opitutaceae bacterium]|nr:tRNA (adenosine(37)-N6)-threonylcarbamoyltransferase complex transferase subunit TsaD [Opitutaceae bacterium]
MILGVESSCDETALAVFDPARGLCGEWVHSQIALHQAYGGVVPDLASREHLRHFAPLLRTAATAGDLGAITQIAVTRGPGLAACLAMGVSVAKALALEWGVPLVGGNHLRGHAWSPFIILHAEKPEVFEERLAGLLPHLGLLVSGGNTVLLRIDEARRISVLASTLDDAAGEALDKGAKLLGLGYPGGPLIEKHAAAGRADAFDFPRGTNSRGTLDFSYSGLKTSLRYTLEKMSDAEVHSRLGDLCASYQAAVVDSLARRTAQAFDSGDFRSVGLSGGVANNRALRASIAEVGRRRHVPVFAAEPRHTGDNAAMIAFAAWMDRARPRGAVEEGAALTFEPALELAG